MADQEVSDGLRPLALLEPHTAELAPHPFIKTLKVALAFRMAIVSHPARKERVEVLDHPFQTHATVAPGDLPRPILEAVQALGGDAKTTPRQQPALRPNLRDFEVMKPVQKIPPNMSHPQGRE